MKSKLRPRCFFDIDIGHSPAGRIIFELYDDLCPKTTDNFLKLCTGECGLGQTTGKKLHYLNSTFHRVIKGFMIQGGDFSMGDGTGGESIYGGRFNDENLETPHDRPFLLSMANCGPNTNSSQFFITTKPAAHLDGKHVVFGHVVTGENLIESIESLPVNINNKPIVDATISNCGELIPVRKKKSKKVKTKLPSVESSSSKGKKKKKSKKKKHRNKRKMKITKEEEDEAQDIYPKCSVRIDEIPEVPKPYFLYRGNLKNEQDQRKDIREQDTKNELIVPENMVTKDIIGRSGRIIKGRGQLRYYSRSPRDRFETTPEWRNESYKVDDRRRSRSRNAAKERDRYRREQPAPERPNERDNNDDDRGRTNRDTSRDRRKRYYLSRDCVPDDDRNIKHRPDMGGEIRDYGDIGDNRLIEKLLEKSVDNKLTNDEKMNATANHKPDTRPTLVPPIQPPRSDAIETDNIIFPYADESDDSSKPKKVDKSSESKVRVLPADSRSERNDMRSNVEAEPKPRRARGANEHNDRTQKRTDRPAPSYQGRRSRSVSSSTDDNRRHPVQRQKSRSAANDNQKRQTHSPPAHLIAKWQNRRDKIMTRRSSPMSRSKERNHSRPRYSPRRHSPKRSITPKPDTHGTDNKPQEIITPVNVAAVSSPVVAPATTTSPVAHKLSEHSDKKSKQPGSRKTRSSSSGTADSSLSSDGSSVLNDSAANAAPATSKEKLRPASVSGGSNQVDKITKENHDNKPMAVDENSEKHTLMILKPQDKPWLTNQWKAEEEEANRKNTKPTSSNSSVLAKLREDDQKKKVQVKSEHKEKPDSAPGAPQGKKVPSPTVSQSISKYRSPSASKSSDDHGRSSYSSSSSSVSYRRRRSTGRRRSRSRSRTRSRSRSGQFRKKYHPTRYRRSSRRSTSRSGFRRSYRSRSHSRSSRKRFSSRSSSTSRSSRYMRSSRRNYRGLGFRRPSVSPRPRK